MANIEEVKKGLECCIKSTSDDPFSGCDDDCPYNKISVSMQDCMAVLNADALELSKDYARLKEQHKSLVKTCDELLKTNEPIEPMVTTTLNGVRHDFCGKCGRLLPIGQAKFCPECGQAVKWK